MTEFDYDWKVLSDRIPQSSEKKHVGSEKSSEKILRMMEEQPTITTALIAKKQVSAHVPYIDKQIAKLKIIGRLRRIGADRGGHWEVIK